MFEYKINEHNYFIIQRAYHEYESHVRVLRFMLSESVCNDITFSDDIWDYWYTKTIEANILRHYLLGYVVNNMFGEVPTFYTISDDATSIYTNKEYDYVCENPYIYQTLEYGRFLAKTYTELTVLPEGDEDWHPLARTITFQVTEDCNLACTYCYQTDKKCTHMPFSVAKQAIENILTESRGFDKINTVKEQPAIIIDFIGGEPLMETDLINQIIQYFLMTAVNMRHPYAATSVFSMSSNGTLFFEPKVQQLYYNYLGKLSIGITVDGTKELHDKCRLTKDGRPTYDIAHKASLTILHKKLDAGTKITLSPDNIMYLKDSLLQMVYDGYKTIFCNAVYEKGWELEHAQVLYQQCKEFSNYRNTHHDFPENVRISLLRDDQAKPLPEDALRNWCGGTGDMLCIDPFGNLYPCVRYTRTSLGPNVKPIVLGDVWNGYTYTKEQQDCLHCLKCVTRRTEEDDQCFYCPISEGCAWCSAYNYQVFGTADKRATFNCIIHRATALALAYYNNSYYDITGKGHVTPLFVPECWAVPIVGQEEYNMLNSLTKKLNGFVNDDNTIMYRYLPEGSPGSTVYDFEYDKFESIKKVEV